jgi:hypothetical protein
VHLVREFKGGEKRRNTQAHAETERSISTLPFLTQPPPSPPDASQSPFGTLPAKFKLIYKSDVVVHFVNSVLLYMNAFVNRTSEIRKLNEVALEIDHFDGGHNSEGEQPHQNQLPPFVSITAGEPVSPDHITGAPYTSGHTNDDGRASPVQVNPVFDASNPAVIKNAEDIVAALKKVSEGYSRILLQCSNFESSASDRDFFECFYYFVSTCVKFAMPKHEAWEDLELELGRLFRGDEFSDMVNPKMNRSPSPEKGSPLHLSGIKFKEEDILQVRVPPDQKKKKRHQVKGMVGKKKIKNKKQGKNGSSSPKSPKEVRLSKAAEKKGKGERHLERGGTSSSH